MGSTSVLLMTAVLGLTSFGIGIAPLYFTFSRTHVAALSILGTGLLLGSALGIIIPEGVEALGPSPPEGHLSAALLVGFAAMATIEHFVGGHVHAHASGGHGTEEEDIMLARRKSGDAEFDAEAFDPDHAVSSPRQGRSPSRIAAVHDPAAAARAFPLTLGLCFHGLTDGLALGASALAGAGTGTGVARRHEGGADLSVVVFFALLIHKAPTALALTTSLLGTELPPAACKRHIAFFAASTPIGALLSYGLGSLVAGGVSGEWTGLGMLVSGGSFLYVATVLQPVSDHGEGQDVRGHRRLMLLLAGMGVPWVIARVVDH